MSIVITATSGHLGRLAVRDLLARGVTPSDIVAGARSVDSITDLAVAGVRTTVIDYDRPETVQAALEPGETFVLISGNDIAGRDRQHADVIAAAMRAKAGRLIYTSGLKATESPLLIAEGHATAEGFIRDSGLPFTILRNGWYSENYERDLPAVRATGVLRASVGDGKIASASRADFAAAIGTVAATDGHEGQTYELSGDVAWTYDELASALAEVLDRDVTYQSLTADEHQQMLEGAGLPPEMAGFVVAVDQGLGAGAMAFQNGDLARLIGRPTTPLIETLRSIA
ncbi:NAD(P)H-binding protein [Aeromicrobium sp. Sec7.5]|uniref:NAD(P)H-binding protein n=1 Tax=Aeromicrobium sp. Sec7.5 TaxID=3121276 RepID=UPI002FE4431D